MTSSRAFDRERAAVAAGRPGAGRQRDTRARSEVTGLPAYLAVARSGGAALAGLRRRQRQEQAAARRAYRPGCPRCGQVQVVVDGLGRPYRPAWYSDEFDRQVRAAGLPRVPLRWVRHSAASMLGSLGVPILQVAAWLGPSQGPMLLT